jgi:hypothetical protein
VKTSLSKFRREKVMAKIETVEINGVIVNKGEEETAAKWAKAAEKSEDSGDETTKTKGSKKAEKSE